ncbi:bifunctional lysine-specific demethylase and histidyl-hydroxylase NO66-like isoform X2 [Orbicella faveolata]|uniref:bifunctional lysine-specific demethylase and histidyl-hydroxylase NO66-like isoform X2 n=1 Tax=Orbicella faveolata TaxID=48498 RepID=UPI0009E5D73C|nr:bifunctional lysine-specific demethylase and histidyl-hydroxylase NO66-like isoform X2 [Orbicella faveolata]
MKSSLRRRSAFGVYQSQLIKENETSLKEEERLTEPSGSKKRSHEDNSSSHSKKTSKLSSSKSLNTEDENGNFDLDDQTADILEPKQKGKGRLFSKANKLRQSLGLSSRKKKRNGYRSYDRVDLENSSSNLTANSLAVEKADKTDSETGNDESDQQEELIAKKNLDQEDLEADGLFSWLISPVKARKFFSDVWEQKPLLIKRHHLTYNDGWFSTKEMDDILRKHRVYFSVNLDVTSYRDGKRETHNPRGRAHAPVVWDYYENGCSVRFLNPQAFSHSVWKLTSLLQEYFGCLVGANVYLTPPGSQGFAPHYDDIEAFVVQLEGRKHWRLYNPRSDAESLPRYSSANFSQEEIGDPILDTELAAGDILYFPRGTIHQADTPSDTHSLHITLSTYQKNSWTDFMEKLIPGALQIAFEEDREFRQGLPLNYLDFMGVANSELNTKERSEFLKKVENLMMKLVSHAPVDAAADQLAVGVLRDCLPPVLTEGEARKSVFGDNSSWKDGQISDKVTIGEDTEVRLIRKGVARLVVEGEVITVYHTLENSRVYHEKDLDSVEFGLEAGPVVESILRSFPDYIKVKDLPHDDITYKIDLVTLLYEKGILVRK